MDCISESNESYSTNFSFSDDFQKSSSKNISRLAMINQRKKYAEIKLFKVGKRKYSAIIQCKAHKTNSSANTFTAGKKRNKQLNRIEQGLFWNYATWNWRYVQVLFIETFPRLLHAVRRLFWALEKVTIKTSNLE